MLAGIEFSTGLLGLFLALPLLAMTRSRPANAWLGLFILSISLLSLAFLVYGKFPQLFGLFDWPLASVGAFFYCYVRSLTGLGNSRRQLWHFLPLALLVSALVVGRFQLSGAALLGWLLGKSGALFSMLLLGFQLLAASYAVAALYRLSQYRQRLRETYSSIERRELHWLSWLSVSFIGLLILWFPANLIGGFWDLPLILGRLITLYFVGWFGLRQPAVFLAPTAPPSGPVSPADAPSSGHTDAAAHKYARSGMTEAAGRLIGERLARWAAQERGYLNPEIKLSDLAECIGTSSQLVSQYLNDVLGLSFFDYINALRVAEIQTMMRDRANDTRTLLDLAFAAGFSSKSTFNTSFKKISGLAPSIWRSQHGRTSGPIG
jgi:AraC-like DNA-binding protein